MVPYQSQIVYEPRVIFPYDFLLFHTYHLYALTDIMIKLLPHFTRSICFVQRVEKL